MTREIKFRAKNAFGKWIIGYYVQINLGSEKEKDLRHYIFSGKCLDINERNFEKEEVQPKTLQIIE